MHSGYVSEDAEQNSNMEKRLDHRPLEMAKASSTKLGERSKPSQG